MNEQDVKDFIDIVLSGTCLNATWRSPYENMIVFNDFDVQKMWIGFQEGLAHARKQQEERVCPNCGGRVEEECYNNDADCYREGLCPGEMIGGDS